MIALGTILVAASIPLSIDANASEVDGVFEQVIHMPGTLIGNFDAKTNPEGTSTLPGVWGGSGNQPIDCELEPMLGGPYLGPCSGELAIDLDSAANMMTLEDLRIDAFEEGPASFPLSMGILFETFRTFAPDSLFPGGVPVDIPIGEGSITAMRIEQQVALDIALVSAGDGHWTFAANIPVLVTVEAEILGSPTGPVPLAAMLSLAGTLEASGGGLDFQASASWESEETVDDPPLSFVDIPFEAPTIIPPGQTAHLLLSAGADSATSTNTGMLYLEAHGQGTLPGDVDGDGVVGVSDLLAVIAAWGPCSSCSEDINADGVVNVSDVLAVIANWS